MTQRMTMAQALVAFLEKQSVERDGRKQRFFAGMWGIFGHGNVAGLGEALLSNPSFPYYLCRNEQAMGHTATAFARANNRLRTFACTSSIGPGATNMVTSAATATINRLPLLLLPGDIFARRNVGPVLQQLEYPGSQDVSVNDAFKPVSRYWDRINRADQLPNALLDTMRVLTSPADTGAVTLALPQDVQSEAWDYPEELFEERCWVVPRARGDAAQIRRAADLLRSAKSPLIVAGGGVIYSEASAALERFCNQTGIAIGESMAGKGSLPFDHKCNLGAIGVTGTPGANLVAARADVVLTIGTRLSDFTTASKTAFQNPDVRFININVSEFDAYKHGGLPVIADAREGLDQLTGMLADYRVGAEYSACVAAHKERWEKETDRLFANKQPASTAQSEVIGVVNTFSRAQDVVVGAAGSLPGDLHKLWRTRDPKGYHVEYGYSCMGYEVAGGLGVKMADPSREVYVMMGDGSYLMMSSEIVTAIQEGYKLNIILLDNHGFGSIGGLSKAVGCGGFGTDYRHRSESGKLDGAYLPVDLQANAASLGAHTVRVNSAEALKAALEANRAETRTTVFVVEVDKEARVPGYESWWDVPVAEVSSIGAVREVRQKYEANRKRERMYL